MFSVVVPVFNGSATLEELVRRIISAFSGFGDEFEILFIDDGSTDSSLELIRQLSSDDSRIGWVSLKHNSGQQHAVLCGLRYSRGDWVLTIDDDLEHPPEVIPLLYRKALDGCDAVYAVADSESVRTRRSGSRLRDLFFSLFLGKPAGLRIGSFRIMSRKAVDAICNASQPFVYISAEFFGRGFSAEMIGYRAGRVTDSGRYSLKSRLKLYSRLAVWYMPVVSNMFKALRSSTKKSVQYTVAETGGFL